MPQPHPAAPSTSPHRPSAFAFRPSRVSTFALRRPPDRHPAVWTHLAHIRASRSDFERFAARRNALISLCGRASGCGDACPVFPGKRYQDWQLDDPAGQDLDTVRAIRDDIRGRIERLLTELRTAP